MEATKRLLFSALGGMGEIGLNSYLYTIVNDENDKKDAIMVDLGMGFNDNPHIPVDTIYPDVAHIIQSNYNMLGIVITHGHEDHIGAIPHIWEQLKCPIYATPWVLDLIISKLKEYKLEDKIKLIEVNCNQDYQIGEFTLRWLPVSHSIPEANLLMIKTPLGNIVHSGDFKINTSDKEIINNLSKLKNQNIDYLLCDSTNVLQDGRTNSEDSLKPDLLKIMQEIKGACWITLFSSNLERISNVVGIAKKLNKKIVLLGRSLENYVQIGVKHHILENDIFITQEEAKHLDRKHIVFLATGSQGEYRSVLYNIIINDSYPIKIEESDGVVFASRIIPGNENKIKRYYNLLELRDIKYYIDGKDFHIHVSGHPHKEELKIMYDCIKPKYIIPMHGEIQHLKNHCNFAIKNGYNSLFCLNGDIVELFPNDPHLIGSFTPNKKTKDGNRIIDFHDMFLKTRSKIFTEGCVFASIVFINNDLVDIKISPMGLLNSIETEMYIPFITERVSNFIQSKLSNEKPSKSDLTDEIQSTIKKYFKEKIDKKPIIKVHMMGY